MVGQENANSMRCVGDLFGPVLAADRRHDDAQAQSKGFKGFTVTCMKSLGKFHALNQK